VTVTFNGNTSTGGSMANETFTSGVPQALSANAFTKTGSTFTGWNTLASGLGTAYGPGATITLSANTTLYAQWSLNTFVVTFAGNTNTGGSTANETFTYGVAKALTLNGFTKTGDTFAGWGTVAGGPVLYTNGQSISVTANETLYAQWSAPKTNTSTTLTLSATAATYGNEAVVTYTVAVSPSASSGTVTVLSGSTTICVITLASGGGHCSGAATTLPVGSQSITASYSGDTSHNGSTSSSHSLNISKDNSHSTVSESASNAAVGSEGSVLFTATVTSNYGEAVPAGEGVTIHVGSASCPATTNGSGSASCSIANSALAAGTFAVSAAYAGDSNVNASTSTNTLNVTFGNKPVFVTANSFTINVGVHLDYQVVVNNGPVTWSYAGTLPTGVTFNTTNGQIIGTPATGTSGSYVVTITATNAFGSTSQTFTLKVTT
jgi:uncharacterized repeat protein (TIGR02543 family)